MPGYKDDLDAAHGRIAALEREVAELRAGDREGPPSEAEEAPYVRPRPIGSAVGLFLTALPFMAAAGYYLQRPEAWVALGMAGIALLLGPIVGGALLELVRPCELLVLSGRRNRLADGSELGYRLVSGGRVLRMPVIERVDRMDLRVQRTDWSINHAYSEDTVPVSLAGYQLVAVSADPAVAANAVERFLGRDTGEMVRVANEVLEGHIRAVVAETSLRDLQARRDMVGRVIADGASSELEKLGLELLGLGILQVRGEGERR